MKQLQAKILNFKNGLIKRVEGSFWSDIVQYFIIH